MVTVAPVELSPGDQVRVIGDDEVAGDVRDRLGEETIEALEDEDVLVVATTVEVVG